MRFFKNILLILLAPLFLFSDNFEFCEGELTEQNLVYELVKEGDLNRLVIPSACGRSLNWYLEDTIFNDNFIRSVSRDEFEYHLQEIFNEIYVVSKRMNRGVVPDKTLQFIEVVDILIYEHLNVLDKYYEENKEELVINECSLIPYIGRALVPISKKAVQKAAPTVVAGSISWYAYIVNSPTTVYHAYNPQTGQVLYVGITNNLPVRAAFHLRNNNYQIEVIEGLEKIPRRSARAIEQLLIEHFKLSKDGGILDNKINSVSTQNPNYKNIPKLAEEYLKNSRYAGVLE